MLLVLSSCFFPGFFFTILLFVFLTNNLRNFLAHGNLFVFAFFLVFSCAFPSQAVRVCMGGVPGYHSHPQYFPMICDGLVVTTPSFWPFQPHKHACPQLCSAHPPTTLFALFCVCCVSIHPPVPTGSHSHPQESLITPLCLCSHVCVFPGNFPAIHAPLTYPANPFLCLLVLFLCPPVPPHPTTPI